MKRGDFLWAMVMAAAALVLVVPSLHELFVKAVSVHPYLLGFVKFALLATMGELLAGRVACGQWMKPSGLPWRIAIWGVVGMLIVLMFEVFSDGVQGAAAKGFLWFDGAYVLVWQAFYTAVIMNLTFAPVFMMAHRVSDTYLELAYGGECVEVISFARVMKRIDWPVFLIFVGKTVLLFWIPAHTVTFLLPPEYRILAAAALSVVLGAILAYGKTRLN